MTDTTLQPATAAEFRLDIRDGASDTERSDAKQSVEAMIARTRAAAAQIRAAEANPLEATDLLHDAETLAPADRPNLVEGTPVLPQALSNARTTHFAPPYDFSWAWHDGNGHPPFNSVLNRPNGAVGLDARSGAAPGGVSGFVNAHAGFGVFLRSDVGGRRFPHAVLNPGRFRWAVRAVGVGSNATSEGGFELTVFEDGRLLAAASRKLWRGRVSGSVFSPDESASGSQPNQLITGPELEFTLRAGHEYTFNAGIWVYSDRSTGVGAGAVQSLLEGFVTRMWVFG